MCSVLNRAGETVVDGGRSPKGQKNVNSWGTGGPGALRKWPLSKNSGLQPVTSVFGGIGLGPLEV